MTPREMQNAFELEYNKFDSENLVESHIIFYWLNEAQTRYYKTRYTGNNLKREAFEQTQKRTDDLRTLLVETDIVTTPGGAGNKPNSYIAALPADYFTMVGEEVTISFIDSESTPYSFRTIVMDSDLNTYGRQIQDPYGQHIRHYERAFPLRLFYQDEVELISDGTYDVDTYHLRYIKVPAKIELDGVDCELPEPTHTEIVTLAVNLYLENQSDPREQANTQKIQEQE